MKFVMPLHDCYFNEERFDFSDDIHSIQRFRIDEHKNLEFFFSEYDKMQMGHCNHALVADSSDMNGSNYKNFLNDTVLLILACKAFGDAAFFKIYTICAESIDNHVVRGYEPMSFYYELKNHRYDNTIVNSRKRIRHLKRENLIKSDSYFPELKKMWKVSNRTRNAMHFLLKAYRSGYWADNFLANMVGLEALFSSDRRQGMTRTICDRVSGFLEEYENCEYDDIENLYNVRSQIAHGKLPFDDLGGRDKKTIAAAHAEMVIVTALKKIIDAKIYTKYESPMEIQEFWGQFDKMKKK